MYVESAVPEVSSKTKSMSSLTDPVLERSGACSAWAQFPSVDTASLTHTHLSLQTKPVDPTVDGGAQVQQVVNIECVSDFTEAPVLNIQFR